MDVVRPIWSRSSRLAAVLLLNPRRKELQMGPIGCLVGLIAQIIHMVIMLITLPFILLAKMFGGGKE